MLKSKSITIAGKSYTLKPPTVGEYQTIQALKMQYTRDKYGELVRSGTIAANIALDYADAFAHIQGLFPKVLEVSNVQSFEQLQGDDAKAFVLVYKNEIHPYMQEWEKIFKEEEVPLDGGKAE